MVRRPTLTACPAAGAIILFILLATFAGGCTTSARPVPTAVVTSQPTLAPVATPSVLPSATPSPTPSPAPDNIVRTYQWSYQGMPSLFQLAIPQQAIDRYRSRPHSRGSDYAAFAISAPDRPYLPAAVLKQVVQDRGYGEYDAVMLVQSFVQSLQNTAGYDDRPKYPVETLADRGGDSEDASILAAALLNDMGYDAVVIGFPGHMAVGVKGAGDLSGRYYTYNGADYYNLETSMPGYDLGAVPDEYRNLSATILPMNGVTLVAVNATVEQAGEEALYVSYKVRCDIQNTGTGRARNVSVYFAALALIYGPDRTWTDDEVSIGDIDAGSSRSVEATLKIPRSGDTQVECIVSGDNFDPVAWKGEQFNL